MPKNIQPLQENKKPFHRRNGSGEINVFEAARYLEDTDTSTLSHKHYMRESVGRLSLDIPNNRRTSIPLQTRMMEKNRQSIPLKAIMMMDSNSTHVMNIKNEKKHKQPSSPGGKLAHFLNSLFNQTSSKKSKSKSMTSTQSIKDEDESPSGWRRKRRSSISLFRSGNSDTKPAAYSTTTPTKRASYKDLRSCSDKKPTYEVNKLPLHENYNKNENLKNKSGISDRKKGPENVLVDKGRVCEVIKHDDHNQKYDSVVENIREFKRFSLDDDDDDGDSDSSSDLFELTNCDLSYYSSDLPVFETTHMDSIKRGIAISS